MAKKQNKLPVAKSVKSEPMETKADEVRERRWRAESGLRTIQEAEEIRKDKQRMNDIKALAKEQMACLSKIK